MYSHHLLSKEFSAFPAAYANHKLTFYASLSTTFTWAKTAWTEKMIGNGNQAVRSAASSYAAMRMVAGSRPVLVIA